MSGFITTMFVTSSSDLHGPVQSGLKPLRPVHTFAQSKSCIDIGVTALHGHEDPVKKSLWAGRPRSTLEALALAEPQSVYKSPLQRFSAGLRAPLLGGATKPKLKLDTGFGQDAGESEHCLLIPKPQASPKSQSSSKSSKSSSPTRDPPSYSYKLLPGGASTLTRLGLTRDNWKDGSGRRFASGMSTGTVSSPESRARKAALKQKSYFKGGSLLSSLFPSNPRTRAPFKPQKSGRGTSSWQLKQYAEATLGSGSLRKAVKLPEGEDKDEWLAVNGEFAVLCGRLRGVHNGVQWLTPWDPSRRLLQPD